MNIRIWNSREKPRLVLQTWEASRAKWYLIIINESDCLSLDNWLKGEMTRIRDLRNVKVQEMERGR